jgi:hypothetical protein
VQKLVSHPAARRWVEGEYLDLNGRNKEEAREDCIMKSFVVLFVRVVYRGWGGREML